MKILIFTARADIAERWRRLNTNATRQNVKYVRSAQDFEGRDFMSDEWRVVKVETPRLMWDRPQREAFWAFQQRFPKKKIEIHNES